MGLEVVPSHANFLLVQVGDGKKVFEELQAMGIITRPMPPPLNEFLRISIGTEDSKRARAQALGSLMKERNTDS